MKLYIRDYKEFKEAPALMFSQEASDHTDFVQVKTKKDFIVSADNGMVEISIKDLYEAIYDTVFNNRDKNLQDRVREILLEFRKRTPSRDMLNRVGAIKYIRDERSWSIKQSKDWVDTFIENEGMI